MLKSLQAISRFFFILIPLKFKEGTKKAEE